MLTREEMINSEERKTLRRPLYYVRTSYGDSAVSRQQIWIINDTNYETIAIADTGGYIDCEEESCHTTFERLINAQHDKAKHPVMYKGHRRLLMSQMFDQLEKRLCLDPYLSEEKEETSTVLSE